MIFSGTQIFEYTHTQGKSRLQYNSVVITVNTKRAFQLFYLYPPRTLNMLSAKHPGTQEATKSPQIMRLTHHQCQQLTWVDVQTVQHTCRHTCYKSHTYSTVREYMATNQSPPPSPGSSYRRTARYSLSSLSPLLLTHCNRFYDRFYDFPKDQDNIFYHAE